MSDNEDIEKIKEENEKLRKENQELLKEVQEKNRTIIRLKAVRDWFS